MFGGFRVLGVGVFGFRKFGCEWGLTRLTRHRMTRLKRMDAGKHSPASARQS